MTEPADDDELDRLMGSMRGIVQTFRELPEEEPPTRGLDALMAAARTKAAELAPAPARESWWRRTLALLTRPPVLAAATVIVLVGSTVMLTRRSGMDTVATKTASDVERPAVTPDSGRQRDTKAKLEDKETARPTAPTEAAADRPVPRPRAPVVVARPDKPAKQPEGPPHDEADPSTTEVDDATGGAGVKAPTTVEEIEKGFDRTPRQPTSRPQAQAEYEAQSSVLQLIKQAELAADRKDCAAVKTTTERIRKLDQATYKTRVITQAAIKRCL